MEKKKHYIPVTEKESVDLIQTCSPVEFAFGAGGVALTWTEGEPLSPALRRLSLLRGVGHENMQGAGI